MTLEFLSETINSRIQSGEDYSNLVLPFLTSSIRLILGEFGGFSWNLSPNSVNVGTPSFHHCWHRRRSPSTRRLTMRVARTSRFSAEYASRQTEGFAFAHCTTCKAPYYLRADTIRDRRWRTLKFRFFVARDITFIFLAIQMVIALLAYLVYLIDGSQKFWLHLTCGFGTELSFYYLCGTVLFFAFLGFSGCFITCFDQTIHNDPALPCRELRHSCCDPGMCADCQLPLTLSLWSQSCDCASCECGCLEVNHEAGLPILFIMAIVVICLFSVFGIFYSVLVASMVGQRIWQRHYHILAKRMLTEEYVVEDVDDEMNESTAWSPPPLTPDHVQRLKALGLL